MESFEKSITTSVRVDARDLATLAKWFVKNRQGELPTRSRLVALTTKLVAKELAEQDQEIATSSTNQAHNELQRLGLLPQSRRSEITMFRALGLEELQAGGMDQGEFELAQRKVRKMFAGEGFGKKGLKDKVDREINELLAGEQGEQDDTNKPEELMEMALGALRRQGKSPEEIERYRQNWQQSRQATKSPKVGEALDADDPAFRERYAERERQKREELKAGLRSPEPPARADAQS